MKALFLVVVFLALSFGFYKQTTTIAELQTSLSDEQAKNTQLQSDLDNVKKELAALKANAQQAAAYKSPLSTNTAPTPKPVSSGDWMWQKKSSLDGPSGLKVK